MKRLLTLAAIFFTLYPAVNLGEGFTVDISTMEAIKPLNVLNISSLAVGETALVSIYRLAMCIDNEELKIASTTELHTETNEKIFYYEITRNPNNELSVVLSKKGKKPDSDALRQAIVAILSSSDCRKFKDKGIPLFRVKSFLGAGSLSELLANTGSFAEQAVSEMPSIPDFSKLSEVLSDWVVTESKSPIDDSPSVTMVKIAEDGNQTLVIRCRDDKTDVYITTDDFFVDESISVIVRYDKEKATKQNFLLSTSNRGLFFRHAISNIKTMMKAKKIVIGYNTYGGTLKTVSFKLDGLSEKITSLRKACHW
jgi:type VI secretion system VasI family protein